MDDRHFFKMTDEEFDAHFDELDREQRALRVTVLWLVGLAVPVAAILILAEHLGWMR